MMYSFKNFIRYSAQFLKNTLIRNKLEFLIFFVTSRCNCRCKTCFYWQEINKLNDLSIDEIARISNSIGRFRTLLLSGGEPFLREGLFQLCRQFIENNKISALAIPTNGILTEKIINFCAIVLKEYPRLILSVAVSLDGTKDLHDSTRGVEGVFDKAIETLKELLKLKKQHKNFEIIVNTVITNKNIGQLESFMNFIFDNFDIDSHDFELLRGDYRDKDLSLPQLGQIENAHNLIVKNRRRYLKRKAANFVEYFSAIGLLKLSQKLKERCLAKKKPFSICSAGKNIAVLDANGDVKLCELLPAVGNLRDTNYDFKTVLNSKNADELRMTIKKTHCNCTHVCFNKLTASSYFRTIFYLVYHYLFS